MKKLPRESSRGEGYDWGLRQMERRRDIWTGGAALIGLALSSISTAQPRFASAESLQHDPPARAPLAVIHAELEALEGEAFEERAEALLAGDNRELVLDAILLRAGRPVPPGLTGARLQNRTARRDQARSWMNGRSDWFARARDVLPDPEAGEDLRCAALLSLGEAGQLRAAVDLSWVLGSDRFSPRVRECARDALLSLTGRRFETSEQFAAVAAEWSARDRAGIFADEFLERAQENDELKLALLELDPARIPDALRGAPTLRAAAIRAVARGVGRQGQSLDDALTVLFTHLASEHHPEVLHVGLEAIASLAEGLGPDAAAVHRLRTIVTTPPLVERLELAPSIAVVLARLPAEGEGFAAHATQVAQRIEALADEGQPVDYEALGLALDALEDLLERAEGQDLRGAIGPSVRVVLSLLSSPEAPPQARLDAMGAAGWVLSADEIGELFDAIEGERSPRLRLALLDSVSRLAPELDEGSAVAPRLASGLITLLADEDGELRRQAIELLCSDPLAPHRSSGVEGRLVTRLGVEPLPAVRDAILEGLARLGPAPHQARALAELAVFDELMDDNHRRVQRLEAALSALLGKDGESVRVAALRLARDAREGVPTSAASAAERLRSALRLITSIPVEATADWPAEGHAEAIRLALELGAAPRPSLERLVEVHLPLASGLEGLEAARLHCARDLARVREGAERDVAGVLAAFEAAEVEERERLLARARWRLEAGERGESAKDWNALLFTGTSEEPEAGLSTEDLRRARDAYEAQPLRAARVAEALVTTPGWNELEPGLRLSDLLSMGDLAVATGNPGLLRDVHTHLAGVPEPVEGEGIPQDLPTGTLWSGTLERREDHEALWRRLTALQAALEPQEDGGEEEAPAPVPETPEEDTSEDSSESS